MSTTFQRLAGNTSRFAIEIAFRDDPELQPSGSSELEGSWGSFQIWVDGRNLCEHHELNETVESVHWYLLPLFEWFLHSWDPLFHEERPPVRGSGQTGWALLRDTRFPPVATENTPSQASEWSERWSAWWRRHALLACREGGIFPDVVFRRWRDQIEVSWGPNRVAGQPDHFQFNHSEGFCRLDPHEVVQPVCTIIEAGLEYLRTRVQSSDRLAELDDRLVKIRDETPAGERLMWMAGLGTDAPSMAEGWRELEGYVSELDPSATDGLLVPVSNELAIEGSPTAALMFGTVAPEIGKVDALSLLEFVLSLTDSAEVPLDEIASHEPLGGRSVWEQGYDLALELLEELDLCGPGVEQLDLESLLEELGVELQERALEDRKTRGVAVAGEEHRPGILLNESHGAFKYPSGRRFAIAHELCHLLYDRRHGTELALVSGEWAPEDIEKRANAFAAMLLMPPDLIERALDKIGGELGDADGAVQVASDLGTSTTSLLFHLENLGYIDSEIQEDIRLELDNR